MYRVAVTARFEAGHRLRLADGRYEPHHRHNWLVEASFAGQKLDKTGVLIDFGEAREALEQITARLHETDLNACPSMSGLNPSAEHVARIVFDAVAGRLGRPELLESVRVEEAPGCTAAFFRGQAG